MNDIFIPTPEHFSTLERLYASAAANVYWMPTITVGRGHAEVRMTVRDDFHHPAGAAHGATYFKVLDDAMFFAVNSLTDHFVLTSSITVLLLHPVTSGPLRAVGAIVHTSSRLWLADGIAYDERDRIVARASGTFMKSRRRIDELIDASVRSN
jgi:uncharacterized protein (TIGR00369 family)